MSAYIKLVKGSVVDKVTLDDVKEKLNRYIEMTGKTGQQLSWQYANTAFPYKITETEEGKGQWFYLKGNDPQLYKYIIFGVGTETIEVQKEEKPDGEETVKVKEPQEQYFIQVVLPDDATHGDKGKANEFCKYLAKEFKAELHLFNERIMYYNPRK